MTQDPNRIKQTGEVFTPLELVDKILEKLPQECWEPKKCFLDPSSGDGAFLVQVVRWKVQHGSTVQQALETTYGVELMPDNVSQCKERLLALADDLDPKIFGMKQAKKKYGRIVDKNIVCSDAFEWDFDAWCPKVSREEKQNQVNNELMEF